MHSVDHILTSFLGGFSFPSLWLGGSLLLSGSVGWQLQRRHSRAARTRQQRQLRQCREELQQLAFAHSHDFKEPLRMIRLYLQLLHRHLGPKLDGKGQEYLGFAISGARRMQELVNGLCDYSGIAQTTLRRAEVHSAHHVDQALSQLEPAIHSTGAQVTYEGPLPRVLAHGHQLTQVFHHLIGNALKFKGSASPRIRIWASTRMGEAVFAVQDNGIGLDPEYSKRIFALFQKLHTPGDYPGTGVGLTICKRIIENHGGRIWVDSRPGKGATFFFTLPTTYRRKNPARRPPAAVRTIGNLRGLQNG